MVKIIDLEGRQIIIVGTAHISELSVQEVKDVFDHHSPSAVAIELDDDRYRALQQADAYREIDIVTILKQNKVASLLAQMLLSAYQQKVSKTLNQPLGEDMKIAMDFAHTNKIPLLRIDRSVQITLMRIWQSLSFMEKIRLSSELLSSLFEPSLTLDKIETLKQEDVLSAALAEVAQLFPNLKKILVDERDQVMAHHLLNDPHDVVVAVVGAAHVPGILYYLEQPAPIDELLSVKAKSKNSLWSWLFPGFILGITLLSLLQAPNLAFDTLLRFFVINGSLAALGTLLALGHPLSALSAFLMAPVGLLSPVLATGFFAGFVEAMVRKPRVGDFMNLSQDILHIKGYFRNRVAHILVIVVLANLFASLGSIIYSIDLIQRLFS